MLRFSESKFSMLLSVRRSLTSQKRQLRLARMILLDSNCYPFVVTLHKCSGCCNMLDDLSDRSCVPNKSMNMKLFNVIAK